VSAAERVPSPAVRVLRVVAPLGALAMFATIVVALGTGESLGAQGAEIGALVWGRVTFVDLGLALVLGWLWIAWRERNVVRALVWLVLTAVTGSGALLLYVAVAALRADDMRDVLLPRADASAG
jgi:FtsH-binding integral membrane protein